MYCVHAARDMLPCPIVARRRLVGRSDRYRIQAFEILARFRISLYVDHAPRLSDWECGREGRTKSNVPCWIQVAIRDLVVFGLGLLIIFTEAAPGLRRLPG